MIDYIKMNAKNLQIELSKYASDSDAVFLQRFFKTDIGEYGEGDIFIGVRVPDTRKVCKVFKDMPLGEIEELLDSEIHEHRLAGLILMSNQARSSKSSEDLRRKLYELYIRRTDRINNWDLVDVSCRDVVGKWLMPRSRRPLYVLSESENLWERRIAIISTWEFIKNSDFADTLKISKALLLDKHDLIHKACGWMLREVGKKDVDTLVDFLDAYATEMPRTMLRYSLERLPYEQRLYYMNLGKV